MLLPLKVLSIPRWSCSKLEVDWTCRAFREIARKHSKQLAFCSFLIALSDSYILSSNGKGEPEGGPVCPSPAAPPA